jgi:aspartyl-tRNA(Asn)/glutamyl-tRNA(Gln) amidotransferase subunit C
MAKLKQTEIEHVAKLAHIGLSEKEVSNMTAQLGSIIDFVDTIQKTDTANIEPSDQVTGLCDVTRQDEVVICPLSRDQLLANAPDTKDGYIKVPKVL